MAYASAHLHTLYREYPLLERPARAAVDGFRAVELWWPFEGPDPDDGQVDTLVTAIADAGLRVTSINPDSGDLSGGDRGFACDPAQQDRFRRSLASGIDVAVRLGCPHLNVLYGNRPGTVGIAEQDICAREQLADAARRASGRGVQVLLEALNSLETPSYPINTTEQAMGVIEAVASDAQLGLLFDQYHLAVMGEDLCQAVGRAGPAIRHVQVADAPGRHEPGTGEVDYDAFFTRLRQAQYDGAVGLEYFPTTDTASSFGWMHGRLPR